MSYLLEVTLCWAVFYGTYHLLLRAETFHHTNRWYLLTTLLLGLAIPALEIDLMRSVESPTYLLQPITVGMQELEAIVITASRREEGIDFQEVALCIYWLGVAVALARFGYGLWQIGHLYRRSEVATAHGYRFVTTDAPHLPFSFFDNLFWSKKFETSEEDRRSIVRHEEAHIYQRHSHDVVLLELVAAFGWCIPFVYLYKKAVKTTHEYLADAYVTAGFDKKQYGRLLLRQSHPGMQVAISNSIFSSQLKKRIVMMTKTKSPQRATLKYLAALPAVALLCLAFSFAETTQDDLLPTGPQSLVTETNAYPTDTIPAQDEVYKVVDEMPYFPGCEAVSMDKEREQCAQEKLVDFILKHLKYPAAAKEKSIEGMVLVKFVVQKDGSLADVDIVKGIGGGCDEEVLRLIHSMPKWVPGKKEGKPVFVEFHLPVKFKLDAKGTAADDSTEAPVMAGCENLSGEERQKCSNEKLIQALYSNMKYPTKARQKGVEGTVMVQFVIEADGSVTKPEVMKSVGSGCDEEVLRVIGQMPKWVPAKKDGKPVAMTFTIPVKFKLGEEEKAKLRDADSKADKPELLALSIFPNPTSDQLTLEYDVRKASTLRIADAMGKELARMPLRATNGKEAYTLSLKDYPKGTLYITLLDNAGSILGTRILMVE